MYSPHSLYSPHQAFQGVKSSGLYTQKYGIRILLRKLKKGFIHCLGQIPDSEDDGRSFAVQIFILWQYVNISAIFQLEYIYIYMNIIRNYEINLK